MNTDFTYLSLALLAVLGLLGAIFGVGLVTVVIVAALALRKRGVALGTAALAGLGGLLYASLLFGLSLISQERVLAPGGEKYFCEIDCHLAYSVVDVRTAKTLGSGSGQASATGVFYVVSLRTRFDENTTSARRPRNATLTPNPRELALVSATGETFPVSPAGQAALDAEGANPSLMTPLIPGQQYVTRIAFDAPANLSTPRLLLTAQGWETRWLIGQENSWFHKKTWLALGNVSATAY
jgi:hypothetical protein